MYINMGAFAIHCGNDTNIPTYVTCLNKSTCLGTVFLILEDSANLKSTQLKCAFNQVLTHSSRDGASHANATHGLVRVIESATSVLLQCFHQPRNTFILSTLPCRIPSESYIHSQYEHGRGTV